MNNRRLRGGVILGTVVGTILVVAVGIFIAPQDQRDSQLIEGVVDRIARCRRPPTPSPEEWARQLRKDVTEWMPELENRFGLSHGESRYVVETFGSVANCSVTLELRKHWADVAVNNAKVAGRPL